MWNDGVSDLICVGYPTRYAVATSTALSGYGALMTAFGNGNGKFRTPRSMAVPDEPFSVFAGDFNWDGKQDLVLETGYGTASFYAGNGDGTFGAPEAILPGTDFGGVSVTDLNSDGHSDMALQI